MVVTLSTILFFAQEAANPAYPWYNYPGFEVWKFINLLLFIGALILILRRPIGQTMQARREAIRKEGMLAIGKVVFTSREHIIALEPRGKGMMGVTLRYPYEVRKEDDYFDDIKDEVSKGDARFGGT